MLKWCMFLCYIKTLFCKFKVSFIFGHFVFDFYYSYYVYCTNYCLSYKVCVHLFSNKFLPCNAVHSSVFAVMQLLFVAFVYCVEKIKHILKLFSLSHSPTVLVFLYQTLEQYSDGTPLIPGVECRWCMKKSWFFTNFLLYLENDTRYSHSCYGTSARTCPRSIGWCHFQWSWVTA